MFGIAWSRINDDDLIDTDEIGVQTGLAIGSLMGDAAKQRAQCTGDPRNDWWWRCWFFHGHVILLRLAAAARELN